MSKLAEQFSSEILLHKGIILRICKIYRKDPDDQKDLYQDIVLNAWHSYPQFENRSKFSTWLYRVALNTSLYQQRKHNKWDGKLTGLEVIENHPHEERKDERIGTLYQVIDTLNELEKSIVILYLDELTYKEISEITGLTESNVGVKLNRIKSKIKNAFNDHGTR